MRTFGIIGAMQCEIDEFCRISNAVETDHSGFFKGSIQGHTVYIVSSGVGKVNAAVTTQKLIDYFAPDCIINSGIAGGVADDLQRCDIVISKSLIYHDFNPLFILEHYAPFCTAFDADSMLIELADKACKKLNATEKVSFSAYIGTIVSGDCFVSSAEMAKQLHDDFGALCTEMEGAAIAHVCTLAKIPFLVIRSISDFADQTSDALTEPLEAAAARRASYIVTELIAAS